jgi:hypothetical protein
MREAFKYLLEADTVVILPGWEESKGARIEITVAQELGLNLVEYVEPEERTSTTEQHTAVFTPVEDDNSNFGSLTPITEESKVEEQ